MWKSIKFVLKNTWQFTPLLFIFYLLMQIIIASSSLINIFTFKEIIDSANNVKTVLGLSLLGIIAVRLAYEIIKKIIEGLASYVWAHLHAQQLVCYNDLFLNKVSTLDIAKFEDPSSVGLINRAFARINQSTFYTRSIVDVVSSLTELLISATIFVLASPVAAILIVATNIIPIYIRSKLAASSFRLYMADDETKRRFGYRSQLFARD